MSGRDRDVARAWSLGLVALSLLAAPAAPARTVFSLPRDTRPVRVVSAPDGTVWMTDDFGGVTRLTADGRTKDILHGDNFADDLVVGPDGAIWVDNDTEVDRVDAAGRVTRLPLAEYDSLGGITATADAIWLADSDNSGGGHRPRLERLDTTGARRAVVDPVPHSWVGFNALTSAPDGRIVAGPDGAMWFTEGHALGRITPGGTIRRLTLPADLSASDLIAGTDGALWFVSDICVGRMTTGGALTTWPVAGAVQLDGLTPGPDGTLWLADRLGNAIRGFDPASAASAPCGAPRLTRRLGATVTMLSYSRDDRLRGVDYFRDIHIAIAHRGRALFREVVPGLQGSAPRSDSSALAVRDLDGDGEPEVTLLLNWGGAHCCSWSRLYRYDRARRRYVAGNHFWGNGGAEPHLRDLDGDRRPEFISRDDRFSEVFTSYVGSVTPIQIWSYRRGRFRDVTRSHPAQVRRDAARLWRLYRKYGSRDEARGILPAWAADEHLLGRPAAADQALENARLRGQLKAGAFETPRDPRAYIRAVEALLRRTGYG